MGSARFQSLVILGVLAAGLIYLVGPDIPPEYRSWRRPPVDLGDTGPQASRQAERSDLVSLSGVSECVASGQDAIRNSQRVLDAQARAKLMAETIGSSTSTLDVLLARFEGGHVTLDDLLAGALFDEVDLGVSCRDALIVVRGVDNERWWLAQAGLIRDVIRLSPEKAVSRWLRHESTSTDRWLVYRVRDAGSGEIMGGDAVEDWKEVFTWVAESCRLGLFMQACNAMCEIGCSRTEVARVIEARIEDPTEALNLHVASTALVSALRTWCRSAQYDCPARGLCGLWRQLAESDRVDRQAAAIYIWLSRWCAPNLVLDRGLWDALEDAADPAIAGGCSAMKSVAASLSQCSLCEAPLDMLEIRRIFEPIRKLDAVRQAVASLTSPSIDWLGQVVSELRGAHTEPDRTFPDIGDEIMSVEILKGAAAEHRAGLEAILDQCPSRGWPELGSWARERLWQLLDGGGGGRGGITQRVARDQISNLGRAIAFEGYRLQNPRRIELATALTETWNADPACAWAEYSEGLLGEVLKVPQELYFLDVWLSESWSRCPAAMSLFGRRLEEAKSDWVYVHATVPLRDLDAERLRCFFEEVDSRLLFLSREESEGSWVATVRFVVCLRTMLAIASRVPAELEYLDLLLRAWGEFATLADVVEPEILEDAKAGIRLVLVSLIDLGRTGGEEQQESIEDAFRRLLAGRNSLLHAISREVLINSATGTEGDFSVRLKRGLLE